MYVIATGTDTTFQWYNQDGIIQGENNDSLKAFTSGKYYCIVSNGCGSATSDTINVIINTSPSITMQPKNDTVCEQAELISV